MPCCDDDGFPIRCGTEDEAQGLIDEFPDECEKGWPVSKVILPEGLRPAPLQE